VTPPFPFFATQPVQRVCAHAPEVTNARFTYAHGTMFRPGLLLVEAPGADDERLVAIEAALKDALGGQAEHVPIICARSAPQPYSDQGATFVYVRGRVP
jgi:hypothetical protein